SMRCFQVAAMSRRKSARSWSSRAHSSTTKRNPRLVETAIARGVRFCTTGPYSAPYALSEGLHSALEGVVKRKRLPIGKGDKFHEDHSRDATSLIDPEVRVVDPAPTQAARGPLAGHGICGDQETKTPFIATVRDE